MFWTRYERLIDKRLAAHALSREIPDVLPQACRAVADEIQAVIQKATVRDYLNIHGLKLQQAIQDTDQPRWFKRLGKEHALGRLSGLPLELPAVGGGGDLEVAGEMLAQRMIRCPIRPAWR